MKEAYFRGFLPYALAAAVMSLCGGLVAAVPATLVADWGLDSGSTTWVTLAYSLGAAAMAPIMGKLSDVLGRRTTLLLGLGIFGAAQPLVALVPEGSLALVLAIRFAVGAGAAAIAPVVMAYIMTEFPPEKMSQGFSVYMLVASGMVVFGPTVGGVLLQRVGWKPILYLCFGLVLAVFLVCLFTVRESDRARGTMRGFDFAGSALALIFFSMLLSVPTFGQNEGWLATPTLVSLGVGAVALAGLVLAEKRAAQPILSGAFIARKGFILPVVVLLLSQGLLQSAMTNIIMFVMHTGGDSTLSGIATSVMYVGMALGAILIGPLADKREPRTVAAGALVLVALGAALQMTFTQQTGLLMLCAALFLIGLGLGGNGTIFLKVVLSGLPPELAGSGSGTYNVFRDLAPPLGVAVFVPMFTAALTQGIQAGVAEGLQETAAASAAAVSALHGTALVQTISVALGIGVCLFLPRIYPQKKRGGGESGENP
jgi:MFS family permease